ncbi:UNVERIFIED_CONTAM: hypothetical protein FKN15_056333 [Acipenser sinensis]
MFGDLFEEDAVAFVGDCKGSNGKKSRVKDAEPPPPRGAVTLSGIKNQGGTCYLNSLLQTLLFTPEFREALFSLGPEELGTLSDRDKPETTVRVIPLELQRLFARLLLVDQQAASTSDLTDSFGWSSNEEMSQHDVQELNRILFSALESSLVGTSGSDLINRLYHGTVVNQIVCRECGNTSERQEDFLDLTVAVKGVSGLEEALWSMFVEEELFEGNNLYRCGACSKLVTAAKSAKLRKLPPFLTVSLLRFNFDFARCERYKEMGSYAFPIRIDLRPFCEQGFLKLPVWLCASLRNGVHSETGRDREKETELNNITEQICEHSISTVESSEAALQYVGGVEISGEATLEDLKTQVLTLPGIPDLWVPSPGFLRVWVLESKRPCRILRGNQLHINSLKLGSGTEIAIQPLAKEENLGLQELLLYLQVGVPGERQYYPAEELVWDTSRDSSSQALRQAIASHYSLPPDKTLIAKYCPDKSHWMPISSWSQQVSRKKKKKRQPESLQGAPFHLRDGDLIGVKNLLIDSNRDFSTERDNTEKEKLRLEAEDKKKSRGQGVRFQSEEAVANKKPPARNRRPEVPLSINVGVFR